MTNVKSKSKESAAGAVNLDVNSGYNFHRSTLSDSQCQYAHLKRIFDSVIACVLLLFLAVPLCAVVLVQKLMNFNEPVFFFQERIGQNEKVFKIIKFRTMSSYAPHNVATNDLELMQKYTTHFGRFLRKTSIDELPQLVNVLRGEMSLVGPRPLIVTEEPAQSFRKMANLYCIRPGITGLAQISGRDLLDDIEKVRIDQQYLESLSFKTDMVILLRSVGCVFRRENIREE